MNALTDANSGVPIFAAEAPVMTALEKEALWMGTGAAAVDTESSVAAEVAEHHGLPFAVLRVIVDPAHRSIPVSAVVGARENGTTNALAVIAPSCAGRTNSARSFALRTIPARRTNLYSAAVRRSGRSSVFLIRWISRSTWSECT